MELKHLGEFGLIERLRKAFPAPSGVTGIGDDCAVIPQSAGMETLVSTDMLVEGSHFLLSDARPYELGWKSAAANISDIAAMGGMPVGSFLAFALPPDMQEDWMDEFIRGYAEVSEIAGFPLLGGDTTSTPDRMSICVTVLGQAPAGSARLRSAAQTGDLICVTGTLGDAAGGLEVILRQLGGEAESELRERHYRPMPRIAEGRALAQSGLVHAMMDVSDGVGSDLRHILDQSGKGAVVDVQALPLSASLRACAQRHGWDMVEMALCGGEDYELLFTVAPESFGHAGPGSSIEVGGVGCTVIGRITEGGGLEWTGTDKDYKGFSHF